MPTVLLRFLSFLLLASGLLGAAAAEDPDPPARVGGASLVEGDVAYLRDGEWHPLPLNWPVTTGTRLSAAPGARAEVRIGSTAIRLDSATELEFARLDDDATALRLLHGTIDARVRNAEVAREFSVEMPEARATLLEPGRYRFESGAAQDATAVSADFGAARVEAGDNVVVVGAGKRAEVWRSGDFRLSDARADAFDEWALARDRRYEASQSARYLSPETTGYEALDEHGDWREVPQYGPVWIPRAVPIGWAPYRSGRWAWIAPWGWTWVDEAPWGFAPFHYGRWALVGGIWCWVPGRVVARPVYAPALVGWVGGPGWSVSVSIGTAPAVGWFPLAPREAYVPAHRHSHAYVRNLNVAHVTNVTRITNVTNVNYVNRRIERAVTVVPAHAVTSGQPVARSHVRVRGAELDRHAHASPTPPVAAPAQPATPRAEARGPRFDPRGPRPHPQPPQGAERQPAPRAQPVPAQAAPAAPSSAVGAQPGTRVERREEARRAEAPRPSAPVATPAPVQAQPRPAPRVLETRPDPRHEPRRETQRVEPSREATAPPPAPRTAPRGEPRATEARPEWHREPRRDAQRVEPARTVTRQQMPPRPEPRREAQRIDPPRAVAPAPAPIVRAAPPAPPTAATPAAPQERAGPRGDRERGEAPRQRRGEGRGAG